MLCAWAVDAMHKIKGYADGSLYARIEKAATDHLITTDMATWAHEVRLDANGQRHADQAEELPDQQDASRAIDFSKALAEFLFILPSRYDLVAVDGERVLKISVKGSKDGGWGLTQSFISNADYHGAVDLWLAKHSNKTVFCLVQFKGVPTSELPRMYLATPKEIAAWLKAAAAGRGDTIMYEAHTWAGRAHAAGTTDTMPSSWRFTDTRLVEIANACAI
ncbi:hypothetical protein COL154_013858 [Colletotrichum chrysophilum]|nr:hypothetical protein COL154_013858 [Colletotrichum chrysophilum]